MIINFTKKVRKLTEMILFLLFIIGGGVYLYQSKNIVKTLNIEENKNINKYIMDIVFDDESKRIMCNQNVEYVNNTKLSLDKIYFHIYPNAIGINISIKILAIVVSPKSISLTSLKNILSPQIRLYHKKLKL